MLSREHASRREDAISGLGLTVTTVVAGLLLLLPVLQIGYASLRVGGVILAGLVTGIVVYSLRRRRPPAHRAPTLWRPVWPVPAWSEWVATTRSSGPWGRGATEKERRWSTGVAKSFSSSRLSSMPSSAPSCCSSPTKSST